ncbi:hypothetical protein M3Y94_01077500 [Aphelenchoides besseyi]|nr:hypothetical protein M3Y94_01077500 [Aphelenchoides besseyi]KAI6218761.1 hypothetical protein M3Y95_01150200 [Aphelenchoides besseyi]
MQSETKFNFFDWLNASTSKRRAICGLSPHLVITIMMVCSIICRSTYLFSTITTALLWGCRWGKTANVLSVTMLIASEISLLHGVWAKKPVWYCFFLGMTAFYIYIKIIVIVLLIVTAIYSNLAGKMSANENPEWFMYVQLRVFAVIWDAYAWIVATRSKKLHEEPAILSKASVIDC